MNAFRKITIAAASAALVVAGVAGCSMSGSSSDTTSPSAASTPTPIATLPSLTGVDTEVTLDQGFVDALGTLGLKPGVVGTAKLTDGVLSFPITGGHVDYYDPAQKYRPYVQGEIDHDGSGISLTDGKTTVELTNFVIDPGTSRLTGTVTANGTKVGDGIYLFNLDGSTLKPLSKDADGNAVLEGTRVLISPDAAALLNKTYNTDAVTDTLLVGIAKITAK